MIQLLLHLIGDFWLQTEYQALNKKKNSWVCLRHVTTYSLPFLLIGSWQAVLVIAVTHFIIDRVPGLVEVMIYTKNQFWSMLGIVASNGAVDKTPYCFHETVFGSGPDRPPHISFLVYVVCDNTLHLVCNYLALKYL